MDGSPNSTAVAARRVNLLGIAVSPTNLDDAVTRICDRVVARRPGYVCIRDMNGVVIGLKDREFRRIHNRAALVTPDGMPLVWFTRAQGERGVSRVYGPDLTLALFGDPRARGFRHFFYGGVPETVALMRNQLRARYPDLVIAGSLCPPFRVQSADESAADVATINAANPDIVWVGLGTPKQERWMAAQLGRIEAPVMIGIGAAFDFIAGTKRQAPRFVQRSGFEWLFRLATEPRRLWRRYLHVPRFGALLLAQHLGLIAPPPIEDEPI